MATFQITKASSDPVSLLHADDISGCVAGTNITAGYAVQISYVGTFPKGLRTVDLLTAGTFAGIASTAGHQGLGLTIHGLGTQFGARPQGDLVTGTPYFLGLTADLVSDAATAKDALGAFLAVSPTDLKIVRVGKLV